MTVNESQPILTHERNLLTFWEEAVPNGLGAQKLNRVVFDKVLFVRVSTPGDKSDVTYECMRDYPEECPHPIFGKVKKNPLVWERFGKYIQEYIDKGAGPGVVSGTPIEQWPQVDTRMAALLKHNGVYNVEALSGLSDSQSQAIGMGVRVLVQKAKDWLSAAADSATAMEAQRREQATQERFDALEAKYNLLAQVFEALPADQQDNVKAEIAKRGPGRPRKDAAA